MKPKDIDRFCERFASEVKRIRKDKQLSHEQLALLSGVTRSTVSNVEACRKSPTLATCYKLANSLGIRLSELIRNAE